MKRFIVAIAIVGCLLGVIFGWIFYFQGQKNIIMAELEHTADALERADYAAVERSLTGFLDAWHRNEALFTVFVRHEPVDLITSTSSRLRPLLEGGEYALFRADLEVLRVGVQHIWDEERPIWSNIV